MDVNGIQHYPWMHPGKHSHSVYYEPTWSVNTLQNTVAWMSFGCKNQPPICEQRWCIKYSPLVTKQICIQASCGVQLWTANSKKASNTISGRVTSRTAHISLQHCLPRQHLQRCWTVQQRRTGGRFEGGNVLFRIFGPFGNMNAVHSRQIKNERKRDGCSCGSRLVGEDGGEWFHLCCSGSLHSSEPVSDRMAVCCHLFFEDSF